LTQVNAISEHPILPFARDDWRVEPRGSVGEVLAKARQRCAMSIEDVAATTRVPVRYLAAIEAERFDLIPGLVYIKGFVKAFARAVGLCERWAADAIKAALADRRVAA
jgi:cytoskeletal protein RodZ